MKKTTKILLIALGIGLVAAALGFSTTIAVPARAGDDNEHRREQELEPQRASDTVTLMASQLNTTCGNNTSFEMFGFDDFVVKSSGVFEPFTLPAGKVLVVTSFDWTAYGSPAVANQLRTAFLHPAFPVPGGVGFNIPEAQSTALADSTGRAGGYETFPTGIVLQNPGKFCLRMYPFVSGEVVLAVINGFLAPDK